MKKQAKIEALQGYYAHWGLGLSAHGVETLQRCARQVQTLAVRLCNGDIQQDAYDKAQARIWDKLKSVLSGTNVQAHHIEIQGDPRGYCLRIKMINRHNPNQPSVELMPEHFN